MSDKISATRRQPSDVHDPVPGRLATAWLALALFVITGLVAPSARGQEPEAAEQAPPPPESAQPAEPAIPARPRFMSDLAASIGDVAGDLFYWGQSGTLTGDVLHNAFMGAQTLTVDGSVQGDFFAFAASTVIDGEVMGDVYAFTSDLRVSEGATIHGNILAFAAAIRINGRVRGHLLGGGGSTVITGEIGAAEIEAGSLTVTSTAVIRGDLEYRSNEEATIDEGATIGGEVLWNRQAAGSADEDDEDDEDDAGSLISFWRVGWKVWSYLANLIVGLAFLLLGGRATRLPAAMLRERPASGLGFGFVVAVVMPVACLVAVVMLVTLPLGLLGLVLFFLMVFLSRLVTAQFFGDWLLRRVGAGQAPSEYASLALGLLLLMLVGVVPYVGFLIRLAAIILGIGGIYMALRRAGFPAVGSGPPGPAVSAGGGAMTA